jgi:hypothetical protein
MRRSHRMPRLYHCLQLERRHPRTGQAVGDEVGRLELGAVAARPESSLKDQVKAVMTLVNRTTASVHRTTAMALGGAISVHKTRVLEILRSPEFPTNSKASIQSGHACLK